MWTLPETCTSAITIATASAGWMPGTGLISTVAGTGSAAYNGDGIPATSASLNRPWGVSLDGVGNLLIGDSFHFRVRKVTLAIPNTPPGIARDNASVSVNEGATVGNTGTYVDTDGDTVTLSASVGTVTQFGTNSGTWSWSFNATDGPSENQAVTITVDDGNGGVAMTAFNLTVANVAPTITSVVGPTDPIGLVGNAPEIIASFDDPGIVDTHTCSVSWDDGLAAVAGTVTEAGGSGDCTASNSYAEPGVYTVTVTVTDNDGGSTEAKFEFVVIYDPSAGFVTGGGKIDSPPGAYMPDLTLVGKASFGFVSKYKRGASVPTGNTEFQFRAADFNFHSSVYQWLVVAGAARAQFKGSGTVNGTDGYGFLVTATDGQQPGGGGDDKFRIKIWEEATDMVIYDNVGGSDDIDAANPQIISRGSIVVHAK